MFKPKVRRTQLLMEELLDELLLYDVERNQVHCLNGAAMRVWRLCDGDRTVSEIAKALNSDLDPEKAETLVWGALDQFAEKHLLENEAEKPLQLHKPAGLTRGQMLLRLGFIAGMLPIVDSIVSPEAALAQSFSTTPITPITPK